VDLERPIDLVEEVARIYGYEKIPTALPKPAFRCVKEQPLLGLKAQVSEVLIQYGFSEAINYSFIDPKDSKRLGLENSPQQAMIPNLFLRNPLAEDQSVLRATLLPGLLHNLAYNRNRSIQGVRLFELGKIYRTPDIELDPSQVGNQSETYSLGGVMAGHRFEENSWGLETIGLDFFDLKGALEAILGQFPGFDFEFDPLSGSKEGGNFCQLYPFLHPGKGAQLRLRGENANENGRGGGVFGWMGAIHPGVLASFALEGAVFGFEMNVQVLYSFVQGLQGVRPPQYRSIPQFPAIRRDLALVVPDEIPAQAIYDLIFSIKNNIIERIHLFDVYRGKQVSEGKKSLAFAIHYLSRQRTLTKEEVEEVHQKIVERLARDLNAEIRS
jgi:phenylalanyl-tRNA synthetase beta chain